MYNDDFGRARLCVEWTKLHIARSVSAKNWRYRTLRDDGMKISTRCNCGLLYKFRRGATKSRSRTGADRAF